MCVVNNLYAYSINIQTLTVLVVLYRALHERRFLKENWRHCLTFFLSKLFWYVCVCVLVKTVFLRFPINFCLSFFLKGRIDLSEPRLLRHVLFHLLRTRDPASARHRQVLLLYNLCQVLIFFLKKPKLKRNVLYCQSTLLMLMPQLPPNAMEVISFIQSFCKYIDFPLKNDNRRKD